MRAGASKTDITPPVGVRMGGFAARYKCAEGIHDALYARSLYIEGKGEALLLIANDLLNIPNSPADEVRRELSKRLGLKGSAVVVSATHTHSGPSLPPDISADVPGLELADYLEFLRERLVSVALDSVERARFAKLGLGVGRAIVGFNRRVVNGPVDQDVNVLLLTDESDRPIASLVNYACHGVVLGDANYLISADYPGVVSRVIETRLGPGHVSLFANGATGDINPITSVGYACPGTFDDAEAVGRVVAYAALKAMRDAKLEEEPVIRSAESTVSLPLVRPDEGVALSFVEEQERLLSKLRAEGVSAEEVMRNEAVLHYYRKNLEIVRRLPPEDFTQAKLRAARVEDAVLVCIPGEPFVEVGLRIKGRSSLKPTLVIAYANGYHGYIAPSEAYEQGGYEVTPTWWNRLARGATEILIEECVSLMNKLCENSNT